MERKGSKVNKDLTQETERKLSKKSLENIVRTQSTKSIGNVEKTESQKIKAVRIVTDSKKSNAVPQHKKIPKTRAQVSCGIHLDSSIDISAEVRFKRKNTTLAKKLSKELALTFNEIESLMLIYHKFQLPEVYNASGMTTKRFVEVLHQTFNMTDDRLNQYVVMSLHLSRSSLFSMESWIRALAVFLKGTFEEKMKHCYSVYDFPKKNNLRKDHLLHLMDGCFIGEEEAGEVTYDLVDMVLKKMDVDESGIISYENYRAAVTKYPLLMESFGQCLPDRLTSQSVLTTFTPNRERF